MTQSVTIHNDHGHTDDRVVVDLPSPPTTQDIALALDYHPKTIQLWHRRGEVTAVHNGRRLLFSQASVERKLADLGIAVNWQSRAARND